MRQIVLDTETTGLEPSEGHKIIEIGCVELIDRRLTGNHYHQYINPQREVDEGAIEVHGITNEFLEDKPYFEDIAQEFIDYIAGAELIIHNAAFDVGFINHELRQLDGSWSPVDQLCKITDTLKMARKMHPGQRNSLDALCKRYEVDNSQRDLHGALLDSEILADVYLAMTGGQSSLSLDGTVEGGERIEEIRRVKAERPRLKVIYASDEELIDHADTLARIEKSCGGEAVWRQLSKEQ